MSDGKWSGTAGNRTWQRPGSRVRHVHGDAARAARLYEELAGEQFLCDACGRMHPLAEHRACRESALVVAGRAAVEAGLVLSAALIVFWAFMAGTGFWAPWWLGVAVTGFAAAVVGGTALDRRKGGESRG